MGDFSRDFHRPDAGIRTVEGNVAGSRAAQLEKKRHAEQEEFERAKRAKQNSSSNATLNIHSKFQPARIGSVEERAFKAKTVGLVSAKDFLDAAREQDENGKSTSSGADSKGDSLEGQKKRQEEGEKARKERKKKLNAKHVISQEKCETKEK